MAKQESRALDVVKTDGGLLTVFSPEMIQATAEAVSQACGGHKMTPSDLERIVLPGGKSKAFLLEDGAITKPEIIGAVLMDNDTRVKYRNPYGKGPKEPPMCFSIDGKLGQGDPGGECETCPDNQWGTKLREDGTVSGGKRCAERRLFVLFTPDSTLPYVLSTPPSSLNPVRKDFLRAAGKGHARDESLWTFYLETSDKGGFDHPVVRARWERTLSTAELELMQTYRQALLGIEAELVQAQE